MSALLLGLALLSPLLASDPPAAKQGPVAVMPFKNLNADTSLDWLKVGIVETMISDLKKSGKMQVVERDQLDKAIAEITLQGAKGTEESTAAQVGKMVGAQTVVVGGFQKAGKEIRITARYVAVETGVVLDTAKTTGPMTNIFALQDEITARLMGEKVAAPSTGPKGKHGTGPQPVSHLSFMAPRKPASAKTLEAYRLYALSLSTSSDAEKISYLKQSLQADPDFSYSTDALDALEKRMAGYNKVAEQKAQEINQGQRVAMNNAQTPQEKAQAAMQLMSGDMMAFRYKALLADATEVYGSDLPDPYPTVKLHEMAAYYIFLAHMTLHQTDQALQVGEQFMKEFPGGTYYTSVNMQMENLIRQRRKQEEGKDTAADELKKLEQEKAKVLAEPRPPHPAVVRNWDFQPCTVYQRNDQYELAVKECPVFAAKYAGDPDDTSQDLVFLARWNVAQDYSYLGRFAEARKAAEQLVADDPKRADKYAVKVLVNTWPRD